jgi:hypothetical protein
LGMVSEVVALRSVFCLLFPVIPLSYSWHGVTMADAEEWEAEGGTTSDSDDDDEKFTAADRAIAGARVPLAEQIHACQRRWWTDLPEKGAVSLATMHDLQWTSEPEEEEEDGEQMKELWQMSIDEKIAIATTYKDQGNVLFKQKDFELAATRYMDGFTYIVSEGDRVKARDIFISLALNAAAAQLKTGANSEVRCSRCTYICLHTTGAA